MVERCDGGPIVDEAERGVPSPLFQKESVPVQTVVSEVFRMESPSVASDYVRAADSERGLGCIERGEVQKQRSLSAVGRERFEVSALRPPLGAASVSGVRVWRCLGARQQCSDRLVRSFTDRLWFTAGPYVVALFYIAGPRNEAKGSAPVALPFEQRLIALLHSRTAA